MFPATVLASEVPLALGAVLALEAVLALGVVLALALALAPVAMLREAPRELALVQRLPRLMP